ncbi:MAG: ABC transporter substrate-binding protein [Anaerolineae bacterium]|nr:ABC transporter substrate-binding protein [Anaerolineae bacterium]
MSRFRNRGLWFLLITALLAMLMPTLVVVAQDDLPEVPRERTLITQGWDFYNQIPSPDNFNPYIGALLHNRNNLHYTVYESLFYYDYSSGEIIPWQAEGYSYNDDYTEVTINLREGVTWADGEPFTADDVVFTINMLKASAPELLLAGAMNDRVADVTAPDAQTVVITLTRPGPRWALDTFALGQTARFIVMPEHIWSGQDPKTFTNLDVEQGWPLGTGPYRLVRTGDDSVVFDRLDHWWAYDAGLVEAMPAPERIIYVPATVEAMAQLYISNSLDMGRSLPVGTFEAAQLQNPNLIAWNSSGPVWGAPDGCNYRLTFNNQHPPFDDPEIHQAIDRAINRDEIVALAYEGSTHPTIAPLASYAGVQAYVAPLQDVLDASGVGIYDPEMTASIMESKGYTRNDDGIWTSADGEPFAFSIVMEPNNPAGPVIVQQLNEAGFDVIADPQQSAAFTDAAAAGTFDVHLWVHCGSTYDPYLTLEHYHSKYAVPEGESVSSVRAYTRYSNPELDALLDQMDAMVPSPNDETYVSLVSQALEIYLRDLPDITLAEELQVIPFNTTYWTGWPTAENPYTHPFIPWDGFALAIHTIQPAQ